MKKVNLTLTVPEAKAVRRGLQSSLDFWDTYYMFAPGEDGDLNHGNHSLDEKRREMAYRVMGEIDNQLGDQS